MADTANLGITQLTEGQSQKEVTINTAFESFDKALAGKLIKDITGSADVTLTAAEWAYAMYEFTGNATANINIIVPTANRRFSVLNSTIGPPRSISIKTVAAPGVVLTEGEYMVVEQRGTVMIALTSGTGGGGGAASLLELTDTPDTYTGQASKVLAVKTDETGTEFVTPAAGGGGGYWSRTVPAAPSWHTGLLAFWKLEEASGNRVDSVDTNHLTPQGTVANITQAAGKIGNAMAMPGTSGTYLGVADNPNLSAGSSSFTIACWVYITTTGADMGFVGKGSMASATAGAEYQLWMFAASWYLSIGNGTTAVSLASPTTPIINTWTFLVGWYDAVADIQYLQVNNGTPAQAANAVGSYDSTFAFELGRACGHTARGLQGRLDMPCFWKRVLTAQERSDLYGGGNGLDYITSALPSVSPLTITDQLLLATTQTTQERLEVDGGIKLGNAVGAVDGTIRWTGTDFEGRKGGVWVSLTT